MPTLSNSSLLDDAVVELPALPELPLSRATLLENALSLGCDPDIAAAAAEQYDTGEIVGLGISGKMGSGKDTVGREVFDAIGKTTRHLSFAAAIKNECNQLIDLVRAASDTEAAAGEIAEQFGAPHPVAQSTAELIAGGLAHDPAMHARDRNDATRDLLQQWGTQFRREQDMYYWVRLATLDALAAMADGTSFYFTDARFPTEVEGCHFIGVPVVRLNVTRATQELRLAMRDGKLPPESAFTHISETALDDYVGFDLVLNNDSALEPVIRATLELVRPRD